MELFEAMQSRHSYRSFLPDALPREDIERLIEAAATAPSSGNQQPCRFHVATGESRAAVGSVLAQSTQHLEELMELMGHEPTEEALRWYAELGNAPVVIACSLPADGDDFFRLNRVLAAGAALQHILLAATEEGLASCLVTFSYWVRGEIARALNLAEDREVIAMVVLGKPSEAPPLAPRHETDIVDYLD